nr:hypothetical protein [Tanacetum cinerariifolium]
MPLDLLPSIEHLKIVVCYPLQNPLPELSVTAMEGAYGCILGCYSFGMSFDEFDKETGSSDGLQPIQLEFLSYYFFGLVTPFSSIEGQMSGPFSTDSRSIIPCCLFIIYSSILIFRESYMVKDKQENDEIGSKPGKNGKRDEARRSQK